MQLDAAPEKSRPAGRHSGGTPSPRSAAEFASTRRLGMPESEPFIASPSPPKMRKGSPVPAIADSTQERAGRQAMVSSVSRIASTRASRLARYLSHGWSNAS